MAVLTSKDRKNLPSSSFAVPSKAPNSGSYPINDKAHARNALARAAQHGTPAVKAAVSAKVHAKFPSIGKAPAKPAPRGPKGPEPDTRQQSSPFKAPSGMRGGPARPPEVAKGFARHPNGPATSGLDRAMSDHADREHPTRRGT